jgi:hypothetical protein
VSSAIGPFALDEGLVSAANGREAVVRIHNTNTGKIIVSRFPVEDGMTAIEGDLALDGVARARRFGWSSWTPAAHGRAGCCQQDTPWTLWTSSGWARSR